MSDVAKCQLCGELMPPNEQMFKFHGYIVPSPHFHESHRMCVLLPIANTASGHSKSESFAKWQTLE